MWFFREQAPLVLKALGVGAVIGKSFARIFFRNSINIGLPIIICSDIYKDVVEGEILFYEIDKGNLIYKHQYYRFDQLPNHILDIIASGGLINFINNKY